LRLRFDLLGHLYWGQLAGAADHEGPVTLDLGRTRVAYPPGIVAMALITHARGRRGRATELVPPASADVLNYLGRVDFFDRIHGSVDVHGDLTDLRSHRRNPSPTFTEILSPDGAGFAEVRDVVWHHLQQHPGDLALPAFAAFDELLSNIADHSAPSAERPATSFVQVQQYGQVIDLAFGDLGVGFLTSLGRNPTHQGLGSEREAVRRVLLQGLSGLSHESKDRGGGLRHIRQLVQRLGGRLKILSRDGLVASGDGGSGSPNSTVLSGGTLPSAFPGCMAWIQLPRGSGGT